MSIREWITLTLACGAIGTIFMMVLTDPWFHTTLVGRGIAILILTVLTFAVWIAGMLHGMREVESERD